MLRLCVLRRFWMWCPGSRTSATCNPFLGHGLGSRILPVDCGAGWDLDLRCTRVDVQTPTMIYRRMPSRYTPCCSSSWRATSTTGGSLLVSALGRWQTGRHCATYSVGSLHLGGAPPPTFILLVFHLDCLALLVSCEAGRKARGRGGHRCDPAIWIVRKC